MLKDYHELQDDLGNLIQMADVLNVVPDYFVLGNFEYDLLTKKNNQELFSVFGIVIERVDKNFTRMLVGHTAGEDDIVEVELE